RRGPAPPGSCPPRSPGSTPRAPRRCRRSCQPATRSSARSGCCGPPSSAASTELQDAVKAKAPAVRGLCFRRPCAGLLLEAEAGELLLEAREPAAAVDQLLGAAGPGRVRLGVDVEVQRIARLAPGRAGGER